MRFETNNEPTLKNHEVRMSRPVKGRKITVVPSVTYFKPVGIPAGCTDEVLLSLEETEAMRLKT